MIELGLGLGLTAAFGVGSWLLGGPTAGAAAAGFGVLATVIHLVALALIKPAIEGPYRKLMARWAMGMTLRLLGVAVFLIVVTVKRELVPPLPAAIGYVGVLLPLLFSEMRLLR
ncbi:MAG: hypothetical protein IH616_17495 [Gemmatimonadales bacterium]|nr:hypothetical protein [Gemmatimonadales bacterium]